MKTRHLAALVAIAASGCSLSALASTYSGTCTRQPQSKWLSTATVKQQYEKQGYAVRRVRTGGTCYEVYAVDKTGKKVELFVNPATGVLVQEAGKPPMKP